MTSSPFRRPTRRHARPATTAGRSRPTRAALKAALDAADAELDRVSQTADRRATLAAAARLDEAYAAYRASSSSQRPHLAA